MNILVLTSVFYVPGKSKEYNTKIVNYFISEWVDQGHSVIVVYNKTIFPKLYYLFPEKVYDFIEGHLGLVIDNKDAIDGDINIYKGATVITLPMIKYFPHGVFSKSTLDNQISKINFFLEENNFIPDVILGHWDKPQLNLIPELKKKYKCKSSLVFHSPLKDFSTLMERKLNSFNSIGFRNASILEQTKSKFDSLNNTFICYSGIPDSLFIDNESNPKSFSNKISKHIFVGGLIKRKFPLQTLQALIDLNKDFTFDIIGQGSEFKKIQDLIQINELEKTVILHGRISRKEIISKFNIAECFTMISKDEAFGLVYLEAMSCGCIVIGAKNEGIDGIIIHGINGFLCEAGNVEELVGIYRYIDSLSINELQKISDAAFTTSKNFTDSEVAKRYLQIFN
ncbi:glycosyltransferase [Cyclobacterium qasimii]|uniref:Glycosyl transferase, group 1 n=2 Tax=Cyclobacterium qasimii TaxID=1350429 RepID=S7X1D6_9BACT|nr:glycosyltransferase [Cyclobacterium qasimii]EPR69958.1 glycosyl transferase, group 1 [Cyclobacterium qasimii M12-11B]GEO20748.1 hypothetical protein CQA01_12820 [Cyclobacterium qasimii]